MPATTTEVVLRDGSKAVVPAGFAERYPGLAPDEDTLELIEENLGDDSAGIGVQHFRRVKVPAGEANSWMLIKGGQEVAEKKITGILVAWSARRSFWLSSEPDGSQPDCSSVNNRTPVPGGLFAPGGERAGQNPSGKCANCPMSQFGSEIRPDGRPGAGAACREQRLLYLITPGALFPIILHVPRTSIAGATAFMIDLINDGTKFWEVEVEATLVKDKSKNGQQYNKIDLSVTRKLDEAEALAARAYGQQIKMLVTELNARFDRESVSDLDGNGEGISVDEPADSTA